MSKPLLVERGGRHVAARIAGVLLLALIATVAMGQVTGVQWEYAVLLLEGDRVTWLSPDGAVRTSALEAGARGIRDMHGGGEEDATVTGLLGVLNAIGLGGWELMEVPAGEQYLFKRRGSNAGD